MSVVVVSLTGIETTNMRVVLYFRDRNQRSYAKTYDLRTFLKMARLISEGKFREGFLGLDIMSDGVGERLVTQLQGNYRGNMGDYRSHGPTHQLAILLNPKNRLGQRLFAAMAAKQPMHITEGL